MLGPTTYGVAAIFSLGFDGLLSILCLGPTSLGPGPKASQQVLLAVTHAVSCSETLFPEGMTPRSSHESHLSIQLRFFTVCLDLIEPWGPVQDLPGGFSALSVLSSAYCR